MGRYNIWQWTTFSHLNSVGISSHLEHANGRPKFESRAHTVRIRTLPCSSRSMRLSWVWIYPPTHLCGSCPWTWYLEIPTDPSWLDPLTTMMTQVLRFSCYVNYKSRFGSQFSCPLPYVLLPFWYVLQFKNTFLTNGWCFHPNFPAIPSARRNYCPLLSYPVALPPPLKFLTASRCSTGAIFTFLLPPD